MAKVTLRQLAERYVDVLTDANAGPASEALMAAAREAGYGPGDLPALTAAVEQALLAGHGAVHIELTTAHDVSSGQLDQLASEVAKAAGAQSYSVDHRVDPQLLGGYEARAGQLAIHNSIQYRLKGLQQGIHG